MLNPLLKIWTRHAVQYDKKYLWWQKGTKNSSTPPRTHRISVLEYQAYNIFGLRMIVKSGLTFLFWHSTKSCLFHLGSSNSEEADRVSKWKSLNYFSPSFLSQKCFFRTWDFSALVLWVLSGVLDLGNTFSFCFNGPVFKL